MKCMDEYAYLIKLNAKSNTLVTIHRVYASNIDIFTLEVDIRFVLCVSLFRDN